MSPFAINVSGISPESTQTKLDQFFSFCGKISSITLTPGADNTQTAVIVFEKESAAKTALLLNEGTLDGAHLHVASEAVSSTSSISGDEGISQEDKPKAGIVAELLAHGYHLSDTIVERAIEADRQQGISSRFLAFLHSLDAKAGAKLVGQEQTISQKVLDVANPVVAQVVGKTKEVDQQRGISTKAGDYYEKALKTPFGKSIFDFYTNTSKQVADVHHEARRIADEKKSSTGTTSSETAAPTTTPAAGVSAGEPAFGSSLDAKPAAAVVPQ